MWLTATAGFWGSLGVVGYTYAGYPAVIAALGKLRKRGVLADPNHEPKLAIVMAARNEEARVRAKLDNLLALDYPAAKRQIVVVSDGSTDGTDAAIREYAGRGVELIRVEQARGKPNALNVGVAAARPDVDVIVFCDARQRVDEGALRALVAPLADPAVGVVSGELFMEGAAGPGLYWRYEKMIRAAESRVDSVVGATGALYAIRRSLFRTVPPETLLDDVFTPMQIAMQGYRVLFEPEAKVYDQEASVSGEFSRKARTLAGNYQLLKQLPELLNPLKNRLLPQLLSHKLMRLVCPFALGTLFASNVVLVATFAPGWPFYVATLGAQLAGYALALGGALRGERASKLERTSWTFVALNAAAVEGLRRYLKGDFAWTTGR